MVSLSAIVQVLLMNITIDTSVLVAVVTHESSRNRAIEIASDRGLIAPSSVHWEMGNAFSAMVKRGRVSLERACVCIAAYLEIPIRFVDVDLEQALALVEQHRIYAYDAYLLACAMGSNTPLLTLDQPLRRVAERMGIVTLEI
jgi:predicted nucleic acid-binding protein